MVGGSSRLVSIMFIPDADTPDRRGVFGPGLNVIDELCYDVCMVLMELTHRVFHQGTYMTG